ncbi:MAG: rhomboid family intramembrane serine protease [Solobacterium sp.]|nr:rhomboid family intramembrane serine protease [Solobacterium sp.]
MKRIRFNSPVVLWFAILSAVVLLLSYISGGYIRDHFFMCYRSSLSDPLFYLRLFTHVLGHQNLTHYTSNMMMFLLIGPILEEKYGSKRLIEIILIVAFVTGVIHVLLFPNVALLGASGVVFAFILLVSVTGTRNSNEIPLTMLIVAVIYIGQELYNGFVLSDNVSQLTHIIGGSIGAVYGMSVRPSRK